MSFTVKNLLLAGLFLAFFLFISGKMRTGLTFGEVVGFELMFSKEKAEARMKAWQVETVPSGKTKVVALLQNTNLDFLYIIGYVFFGVFLARVAAGESRIATAKTIGWLLVAAGLCDVVENLQILQILEGDFGVVQPLVMSVCASVKFLLIVVSLGWAVKLFFTKR